MPATNSATLLVSPAPTLRHGHGFNAGVHGARGLLALLVFAFHIACSGTQGFAAQAAGGLHAALTALQFGVEIFFCISGFIVVGALRRAAGPGPFLGDRAIRILPVLWLALAVLIPLGLLTHQGQFAGLGARDLAWVVPANLLALPGVLPVPLLHLAAWSLSYELLFYAIAATLWWLPARHRAARLAVLAVAAGLVAWHPRAVFFAAGVLVARVDFSRHRLLRHALRAPGLLLLGFFACWYAVQFGFAAQEGTLLDWAVDGRIGLAAVAVSLAILAFAGIVAGGGRLGRLLRAAPLQWLGTASYSFYLWHVIVIAAAKRGLALAGVAGPWSQLLLAAVALPAALLVAEASRRLVERDFARWIKAARQGWGFAPDPTKGNALGTLQ